ncbi:MAG TPA: hypothetical protein PLE45_05900 [Spirochaetota bacterium]|nr:hypothetical protein [Spirochaetota bacterium]HOL56428.1 hypothetical protein [Spirochaetota bacterium]HPP03419.1 hypothetical protein [Spirochaetota bacterium]
MSDYKYEELLRNSIVDNKIKANHLKHIPKLKTCDRWQDVIFLGRVNYTFKHSHYDGGLVKLNGKIYYINSKQIQALSGFAKWNTANIITVID